MDTNVTIQPLPLYVKQHMKKHCLENHTSPVRDRCVLFCHYSCFWLTSHESAQSNAFVDFVINASIYRVTNLWKYIVEITEFGVHRRKRSKSRASHPCQVDCTTNQFAAWIFPPRFCQSRACKGCFGTSCDQHEFSLFSLFLNVCVYCVGDEVFGRKNCQCCRKSSHLVTEKLAKSTAMPKRKHNFSNVPFCRFKNVVTTANVLSCIHVSQRNGRNSRDEKVNNTMSFTPWFYQAVSFAFWLIYRY